MRHTHLAILVFPDNTSAFQAYRLLQYHGISPEHLAIVGEGYSSPEYVGLREPMQIALSKARLVGFVAGTLGAILALLLFLFLSVSGTVPANFNGVLVVPATAIVSGFCGAVLGALVGFLGEGNTASIYRHHLHRGHYLLMMEGSEKLVRRGQDILSHFSAPRAY